MRPSAVAIVAGVILAGFTVWITRQAKALERDLDGSARKIVLLDKPAPDFRVTAIDGRTLSLSDYRGKKKLVLVFWATWNNVSHSEMLNLGMTYQRYRTESAFDVLGIAVDDDRAAVKKFAAESRAPFPLALDRKRELADAFGIRSLPTVLIVDADGKVVYGNVGVSQGRQNEFAQHLGIGSGDFRMEMGAPRGRAN